jgi:hypothetical protein
MTISCPLDRLVLTIQYPNLATCYDYFQTLHGLPLVALASDPTGTPLIYVAPDLPALASQYAKIDKSFYPNLDPARLAGARVTKIRGQPVLDSLAEFVNTTGIYQDVEQRWNALFASPIVLGGAWDHEPGSFTIQRGLEDDEIELSVVYNGTSEEVEITVSWGMGDRGRRVLMWPVVWIDTVEDHLGRRGTVHLC